MEDLSLILKSFATATQFILSESYATISVKNRMVNSLIKKCLPKIIREASQAFRFKGTILIELETRCKKRIIIGKTTILDPYHENMDSYSLTLKAYVN